MKLSKRNREHERLKIEAQQLQERLDDLYRKENENIQIQNYLQLSLNGLQAIIRQIQEEIQEKMQQLT